MATSASYFTNASSFSLETSACLTPFTCCSADCTAAAQEPQLMPVTSSVTVASFAAICTGAKRTASNNATAAKMLRVFIPDTSGANYTSLRHGQSETPKPKTAPRAVFSMLFGLPRRRLIPRAFNHRQRRILRKAGISRRECAQVKHTASIRPDHAHMLATEAQPD